jgi:D-arabinose 1-dehydrogenase-like Zn-dependent alcohol dehydrogenase
MPESLHAAEAAPLMCAGHSGASAGDLVAVQGVGGLGHLGIRFAKKFGYRVAAVSRGTENAAIAKKLGADIYIDGAASDAATELQKLGGASVVLSTAPSGKAMSSLMGGLGVNGTFVVVGASPDPVEVSTTLLILGKRTIKGWSAGIPTDSEDTLRLPKRRPSAR